MTEKEFEKIKKEELDYKDERLNKIYRITEEDSYEDYEPETELYKDLLAIRLAFNDPEKFEMYFKKANINDIKNDAYKLPAKEKLDLLLTQGEVFNCDYDFEKRIIYNYIFAIKKYGYLNELNIRKLKNRDLLEIRKLMENEANSIMTTNAVLAELKERYNLNFKLFIESGLDKYSYANNKINVEEFINYINNEKSFNLGGYSDYFDKMLVNTTLHNREYAADHIYNQQNLLKTLYHETRHALQFKKIKNGEIGKQEYMIVKNAEYIVRFKGSYQHNHDYFETEIDAIDFAEKEVEKDYKNTGIPVIKEVDINKNRNTKTYDLVNNITLFGQDPLVNTLATLETIKLNQLIKVLFNDKNLPYDVKQYLVFMNIKNNKSINIKGLNNLELRYLKGFIDDIKKEELNKIFEIANGSEKKFKSDGMYYLKQLEKINKVENKIK